MHRSKGERMIKNLTYQDLLVMDGSWPSVEGQYREPRAKEKLWFSIPDGSITVSQLSASTVTTSRFSDGWETVLAQGGEDE